LCIWTKNIDPSWVNEELSKEDMQLKEEQDEGEWNIEAGG